jgi:hypothetical protein
MTVQEEISTLGIDMLYFEIFYEHLRSEKKLPEKNRMPEEQYSALMLYFRDQRVLNDDCSIHEDGLKVFVEKKKLEDVLKTAERDTYRRPSGGLLPCRNHSM